MRYRAIKIIIVAVLFLILLLPIKAQALRTTVRVGFCEYMPPYQYTNDSCEPFGFHVDIFNAIAEKSGLLLEYVPFSTTTDAMDGLEKGDIDTVLGAVYNQFPGYDIKHSDVMSSANICLLAPIHVAENYKNDGGDNYRVIVEFRLISYNYLARISRENIMLKGNQKNSVEAHLAGHAEMVVGIKDCLLWYLDEKGLSDYYEIINNYMASADFTIAVREGDRHLYDTINNGIAYLHTSGGYEDLYNSWFHPDRAINYQLLLNIVAILFTISAIFLLAYFIVNSRAKRKLVDLVREKTSELYQTNTELKRRTDQVEAESRLRNLIIESSPASIVLINKELKVEYMNNKAMLLSGIGSHILGNSVFDLKVFGEIVNCIEDDLFNSSWLQRNGTIKTRDARSGIYEKYRYGLHQIVRIEEITGVLLSVENITLEENEQEAIFEKKKNEVLNSLIAGIAHEIKNPLTAIDASASMIEEKGDNVNYRKAFSTYIPQEIARITRLINNLTDYARPGRSKTEMVYLPDIIRSVCELASVTAKATKIEMTLLQEDRLKFLGDRDKFKQSLLNIVMNSIESVQRKILATHVKHIVNIEASVADHIITLSVYDDGIGMSEEEICCCTEPFYTTKPAGTGIGLAITKKYIEEVGGTMEISSIKNEFTCVTIRLPELVEEKES